MLLVIKSSYSEVTNENWYASEKSSVWIRVLAQVLGQSSLLVSYSSARCLHKAGVCVCFVFCQCCRILDLLTILSPFLYKLERKSLLLNFLSSFFFFFFFLRIVIRHEDGALRGRNKCPSDPLTALKR